MEKRERTEVNYQHGSKEEGSEEKGRKEKEEVMLLEKHERPRHWRGFFIVRCYSNSRGNPA